MFNIDTNIEINMVKNFLRIDIKDTEDDNYITRTLIPSAYNYVCSYTGLTKDEVNKIEDLRSAVLLTCSMLYDNRDGMTSSQIRINPVLKSILDLHCTVTIA